MKRKTIFTVVALAAILAALVYLVILLLLAFGVLPQVETEDKLFVTGYQFLPLPVIGLLSGILLQVVLVGKRKKKRQ